MHLSAGTRIGPYVVIAPLGAGGMGEVYKAHDSKLGRDVALKVLSAALAVDTHYMSRFRNEAKTLASLNHPNIAQIYGLEGNAIVMELVEGPTLADRISGAAIPIQEAVPIAKQIAEGLEAAHQKGIVHRDLKPANIKVTSQGVVKILDFGLAKVGELKSTANPGSSPTLTVQTQAGVILGTAAYMSPEQAEGHPVDERSDIFSFGAVLYEMVTRTRAFRGTSTVSILAAVLREEPQPVRELNRSIPLRLQLIIHRCLAKHVDKRWQNIIDVKLLLQDMEQEEVSQQNESMARSAKPSRVVRFAAPLFLAAMSAGALGSWIFLTRSRTVAAIDPPAYAQLTSDPGLSFEPAISPDGKLLAYASDRAGEGSLDLWVRQLPNGHPVRITSNKADEREPDFSPDGSKIVFRSDDYGGGISVISPLGGEARKIADRGRQPRFSPDGKWIAYWIGERHQSIFGTVWIVPSGGGEPKEITPPEGAGEDPVWAPDSKGVIVLGRILPEPGKPTSPFADGIGWAYLPIDGSEPKMIITDPELRSFGLSPPPLYSHLRPAAFINQRIVFSAKLGGTSTLWGLPVSASTRRASGSPVPLTSGPGLHVHPGAAMATPKRRYVFSALSLRSSIVSVPATTVGSKTLTSPRRWTDGLDVNTHPSISMDGSTLAYISNRSSNPDVWLKNLRTGRETALTETPWAESYARISPNSSQVMFIALRESGKRVLGWVQSVGGIPRTYCTDCEGTLFGGWIDEHTFVYTTNKGLSLMRMPSGKSAELVEGPVLEPRASYDGHWIVFHSSPQPTIRQIFVAPVRGGIVPKEDWIQITGESGMNRNAAWAPDGRRVYFLSDRDGFRCIWAQNLDAKSKRPVGEPFALHHSHSARFSLFNFIGQGLISISATQDQVFFAEPEITGNVWMMETAER